MHHYTTRISQLKDLDALAILFDQYRQFYQQPSDIALAKHFIGERMHNHESIILVAEQESTLIGFCQLYPTFCSVEAKKIAVLYDLFVQESARKTETGRGLISAAEAFTKQNGYARLDLSTAKSNFKAQALYESQGWVRDDVFYYYSFDLT